MPSLHRRRIHSDAAFERLYQRHVKDVYRYSLGLLGAPADAEDVTQTTFLNAYQAYRRGTQPEKPRNWLIGIAHNVCLQRFRQTQRRPHEVEFVEAAGPAADEYDGPTAADLKRALLELPPNQRSALVMRELEGRSYAEIAAILSISTTALETLLFRARRALREQMEDRLTCTEAGFAISKQADGRLSNAERRALRGHLRACPECTSDAQRERSTRRALKKMLLVPLPQSLTTFSGASAGVASTTVAGAGLSGIALKAAGLVTACVVVSGGAYVGVKDQLERPRIAHPVTAATVTPRPAQRTPAGLPTLLTRPASATGRRAGYHGKSHRTNAKAKTHRKHLHAVTRKAKTPKKAHPKAIRGGSEARTAPPRTRTKPRSDTHTAKSPHKG